MKRIKPKLISRAQFSHSSSTRSIRTVFATSPTGDVLDEQQQQDILHQLRTMDERTSRRGGIIAGSSTGSSSAGLRLRGGHHHQRQRQRHCSNSFHRSSTVAVAAATTTTTTDEEAATRVAALGHIWVFRRLEEQDRFDNDMPAVWTTFDYANQMTLMNEQDSDKGIEIFDSHVRQGQLPVLVVPRRQRGYFPLDRTGDAIVTLEIACLPNTSDVQFVLRHYSPP
ncbi:hypothetical protein BDB00DRAFT_834007 [Zychaea mexicana]|uniref:uncharacterized protein n=1 Tax=Zychaea mexicana TaxID=64656 RepID=UPI0022FDCE77|nr:uncharacterized protein BDB00DRAFT_834007 [Zychaea mexicana]KAI9491318.1 hypothetical protein BDB00DRAFT_834007 [Zychaea mexicana]